MTSFTKILDIREQWAGMTEAQESAKLDELQATVAAAADALDWAKAIGVRLPALQALKSRLAFDGAKVIEP